MAVAGDKSYIIDAGSLKAAMLLERGIVEIVAQPGDLVGQVPIKELADLALVDDGSLILLDRSGDVYRFFPDSGGWEVVRLAVEDYTSERQYLAAVAAGIGEEFYILDITLGQVWRQTPEEAEVVLESPFLVDAVDLAVSADQLFFILPGNQGWELAKFVAPDYALAVFPSFEVENPTLVYGDDAFIYSVDHFRRRMRLLDRSSGELVREYRFANPRAEFGAVFSVGEKIYIASRDAIYIYPGLTLRAPQRAPYPGFEIPKPLAILDNLPQFVWPIADTILDISFRLPGAPRSYRYGVHEGTDFFWSGGDLVTDNTPLLAIAEGTVIRADTEYQAPTQEEMEQLLGQTLEVFHTPPDIFDRLRGRQVWIDLGNGMVAYYCHLSAIAEGLEVGQQVTAGQIIGYAGNSGTPEAAQFGPEVGIHLHLEIRIGDGYLGQYLRPIEVQELLAQAFVGD